MKPAFVSLTFLNIHSSRRGSRACGFYLRAILLFILFPNLGRRTSNFQAATWSFIKSLLRQQKIYKMAKAQYKRKNQIKQQRLDIVAELYKKGYSIRQIKEEILVRMDVKTCSTQTVHSDIGILLDEWREARIENTDLAIQLELERIDDTVRELWAQWEKSKTDYSRTESKQKGAPVRDKEGKVEKIKTIQTEKSEKQVICTGDVSYIAEIRKQLSERRKLLGLYAPEKKDISGSFAAYLMESGMIDDTEE